MKLKFIEKTIIVLICLAFAVITLSYSSHSQNIVLLKETLGGSILLLIILLSLVYKIEFKIESENNFLLRYPLILLLAGVLLSTAFSDFKFRGYYFCADYAVIILSVYAMLAFIKDIYTFNLLLSTINFVTFIAGLYAIMQLFNIDLITDWGMPDIPLTSTFGCCCGVRIYFSSFLPIIILSFFYCKNKYNYSLSILALLAAVGASANSLQLYALYIFLITTIIFFSFITLYYETGAIRKLKKEFIPLCFILIIILMLFSSLFSYMQRSSSEFGTNRVKKIIWSGAAESLRDKTFFGYGPGTFQLHFPNYTNSLAKLRK